ncbi:TetR/AcrR family transcriptional regulator [Pseudonocardia sp.]|uniref:TetR/AcrR family transcriptional regulator n=1 Tax=Pseudonocardia sp. TaxID=60912 RepID=UPI0026197E60|nr:TetR/AcrR family transcriptional regulator [Pseudonocardia sp.]
MKSTRPYTQRARAQATAGTRQKVLDAAVALTMERFTLEIVLADVAERAGVSVQTVLRHFGSRDGLFDAVREHRRAAVREQRAAPIGDAPAAVTAIVGHYDEIGDFMLRMLAQEHLDEPSRTLVERGRRMHREWVREVFAPQLAGCPDAEALTDLLVVATDLYTWKLLRRDAGHDRPTTEQRMLRLLRAVLPADAEER